MFKFRGCSLVGGGYKPDYSPFLCLRQDLILSFEPNLLKFQIGHIEWLEQFESIITTINNNCYLAIDNIEILIEVFNEL